MTDRIHHPISLTEDNIANLARLADLLASLPLHDARFGMSNFGLSRHDTSSYGDYPDTTVDHPCGTVACALGWAPSILPPRHHETWEQYTDRLLLTSVDITTTVTVPDALFEDDRPSVSGYSIYELAWTWLFAGTWARRDDTPHGAAARIRYMLEHGVPSDTILQIWRDDHPLSYTPAELGSLTVLPSPSPSPTPTPTTTEPTP